MKNIEQINDVTSLTLNWVDESNNEDGYIIYENGIELVRLTTNIESYSFTKNFSTKSYFYYQVAAYNSNGVSKRSNIRILTVTNNSNISLLKPYDNEELYQTIPYFEWQNNLQSINSGLYEIVTNNNRLLFIQK